MVIFILLVLLFLKKRIERNLESSSSCFDLLSLLVRSPSLPLLHADTTMNLDRRCAVER